MTAKSTQNKKPKTAKTTRKGLPRALVITLRVLRHLRVPILCCIALLAGLSIGYVKLGGQPFAEVWKLDTWKHLIDLVFANTPTASRARWCAGTSTKSLSCT